MKDAIKDNLVFIVIFAVIAACTYTAVYLHKYKKTKIEVRKNCIKAYSTDQVLYLNGDWYCTHIGIDNSVIRAPK